MEKAKVLAVAKETRQAKRKDGSQYPVLDVYLGTERDGVEGYVPSARGFVKDGKVLAFCSTSISLETLGNYRPKVGDMVNLEYNRWGSIVGISKVN